MGSEIKQIREFGKFRLDVEKQVLWHEQEPVDLPLKEIELLCALTENGGEVVTKNELMEKVWADSYVEESNLSRHIYLLRKTFKDYGEEEDLIQTVPRRGYRFAGEVRELGNGELVIEKHSLTQTLVEEIHADDHQLEQTATPQYIVSGIKHHRLVALVTLVILALAIVGLFAYRQARAPVAIDSIAVLPFTNQSNDPETDYLSDGLTESIINNLTQIADLRVIARSSAFRYKGKEDDPFGAGRQLGVRAVVVGRFIQRGENLIVSAELVDVRDNKQIWGEQYTRKMSDLAAVQQDISGQIFEKLRTKLTGEERRQLIRGETSDAEAYQHYLRGTYYRNRPTAGTLKKAMEEFQQAVDKDPTYARAYVGLANCYAALELFAGTPSSETLPKGRAAALRALEIDDLAEAHTSLGYINLLSWQFEESEKEFKRGIELNPNDPRAHYLYGAYLRAMGRLDEAMAEYKRAQQLDPLSPIISAQVVTIYILKDDLNSAIEECKKIIEMDPNFAQAHDYLGWAYLKQGHKQEALAELQKAVELSGRAIQELAYLGYGYGALGMSAEAKAVLRELEERYARQKSPELHLAAVYAGLGDKDQAFAWLERGFQARSGVLIYIAHSPVTDTLRDDPRYTDLLSRMGLRP